MERVFFVESAGGGVVFLLFSISTKATEMGLMPDALIWEASLRLLWPFKRMSGAASGIFPFLLYIYKSAFSVALLV